MRARMRNVAAYQTLAAVESLGDIFPDMPSIVFSYLYKRCEECVGMFPDFLNEEDVAFNWVGNVWQWNPRYESFCFPCMIDVISHELEIATTEEHISALYLRVIKHIVWTPPQSGIVSDAPNGAPHTATSMVMAEFREDAIYVVIFPSLP